MVHKSGPRNCTTKRVKGGETGEKDCGKIESYRGGSKWNRERKLEVF